MLFPIIQKNTGFVKKKRHCRGKSPSAMTRPRLLSVEGHAVGALVHSGIALMGAHQNGIQGAVVLGAAVVGALLYGAFDALVGMAVHRKILLAFYMERLGARK